MTYLTFNDTGEEAMVVEGANEDTKGNTNRCNAKTRLRKVIFGEIKTMAIQNRLGMLGTKSSFFFLYCADDLNDRSRRLAFFLLRFFESRQPHDGRDGECGRHGMPRVFKEISYRKNS